MSACAARCSTATASASAGERVGRDATEEATGEVTGDACGALTRERTTYGMAASTGSRFAPARRSAAARAGSS